MTEAVSTNSLEMFRRAELFDRIISVLEEVGVSPGAGLDSILLRNSLDFRVSMYGSMVFFNGKILDLSRKTKTLALFKLFCDAPDQRISSDELFEKIYGSIRKTDATKRFIQSINVKTVKLVSRARKLAEESLCEDGENEVNWFVYDHSFRGWHLFRLHNELIRKTIGC